MFPRFQPTPPVELRQRAVKAEMLEGSGMKARLKNREEEIKELKLAIKLKAEELSEANVRREMAEKKLSGSAKDADLTIEKLQVCGETMQDWRADSVG